MRHVLIDLSSDNFLQQPQIFGGYAGEHNETVVQVILPKRLVEFEYSGYYFVFQTSEENEIWSPLIPVSEISDGIISCKLTEQVTIAGKLLFNITAQLINGDIVEITSKTNMCALYIDSSPDGNNVDFDPNSWEDELLKMVDARILQLNPSEVDQHYIPDSIRAQSGKAVAEALSSASNAITLSASGKQVILDDISPIEHKILCSVESDTYTTVEGESKNIYDFANADKSIDTSMVSEGILTVTENENGTLTFDGHTNGNTVYCGFIIKDLLENQTYTISLRNNQFIKLNNLQLIPFQENMPVDFYDLIYDKFTFTASSEYDYYYLYFNFSVMSYEPIYATFYPQLELGTEMTEWSEYGGSVTVEKPYVEDLSSVNIYVDSNSGTELYKANANGLVENIISKSPNMFIRSDNEYININCEYNADTKKYIDNNGGSVDLSDYYKKEEIDAKIGDIESVLDNILTIQNEVLGGDGE